VNPQAENILGESCYPNLRPLPEKVEGVVIITKPDVSAGIVKEVHEAGIKHIWIQQGAESKEAIDFCKDKQMNVIHGECILMFAEPIGSFHKFHRWIWKLIGKLPK
jgi:predicted CoA-binding protein